MSMKKCLSGEHQDKQQNQEDSYNSNFMVLNPPSIKDDPEPQTAMHPRMLYEIMKQIKQNGSINSSEIVDLIGKFEDINQ